MLFLYAFNGYAAGRACVLRRVEEAVIAALRQAGDLVSAAR